MYKFFGKPKPLLKINIAEQIEALGLHEFFSSELWPEAGPVRELMTKVRTLTGGIPAPVCLCGDAQVSAIVLCREHAGPP